MNTPIMKFIIPGSPIPKAVPALYTAMDTFVGNSEDFKIS
jgi:hypothetical protein